MKFYGREKERAVLEELWLKSARQSQMAVITGRRRMGKTTLALELSRNKPVIYLFVARKSESLLCQHFCEQIEHALQIKIHGKIDKFATLFAFLMAQAQSKPFILIVDEFQEFYRINASVYSEIQALWDLNKKTAKMMVVFIGSVYSMMQTIFENEKEPLFGRADRIIKLQPFDIKCLRQICADYGIHDLSTLFDFYVLTGGVPKYIDILLTENCKTLQESLDFMIDDISPFVNEGKNQLIEEFGKDYMTYFSILELIAVGKTSSSEIASVIEKSASAYLAKLEDSYDIIHSVKPINAKSLSRTQKYAFTDNFLQFWFRYFYRYRDAIEMRNYHYIKDIILDEYSTYSGRLLENFFKQLIAMTGNYNRIGTYWQRDGKNEIDLVAINDKEQKIFLAEIKRNKKRASLPELHRRATVLLGDYPGYDATYALLSLNDAQKYLNEIDR